ncbi:hypothetical protein IFM89_037352 [Coptis chinensis]|uniref:GDSL esterase/lipase CPRD49 n=1 Tax=Coptis chinensis TaxID=261450 RepID=A0A835LX60_9MAGN|nr:hypothetical protein IFM89_008587 [Coptis chinensis]KAF9617540.1 hypothetical protein IFM89_037352 [Coptis chinensis]
MPFDSIGFVYRANFKLLRSNEACQRYSEACIQLCRDMGVKVIDLYTAIQKTDSWKTSCFIDGVHLSSGGSKIVVDEILKVLKEAEWEPSLYWKSLPSEFAENPLSAHKEGAINADEWTLYRENWH